MKKLKIFVVFFSLYFPITSFSFVLRDKGDMFIGLTGGYGFPQLQTGKDLINNTSLNTDEGKNYFFGLSYGYFLLNDLSLNLELTYNYTKIDYRFKNSENKDEKIPYEQRYVALNLVTHYYWFEFLYLGGGFFLKVPWGDAKFTDSFKDSSSILGGSVIDFGINMRFWDPFSLRIGVRFNFPFSPTLNQKTGYSVYSFPIDFVFALEWVI